ncbi:MAG: aminotransferase class I/II-fold pyridoxal phosphate-dependent enzyme [Rhodospirillales bacterium]|nr:MAG: aminotransferase class I/II-fold pyridoxal phosphate-dependent enzyme [Rhodospirillales bacterium]
MTDSKDQHPATLAARALGEVDEVTGAVIPPIHMATTLQRDENYEKRGGRQYIRDEGHAFDQPEALLAALEGGADAMLFSAGIAACTAAFQALAPGDHVIAPDVMYHGVARWLEEVGRHWGLEVDFIPAGDLKSMKAAVRPGHTRLVWIETPANPTWTVTDITAAADIAHEAGALLGVDSTVATPVHTTPIALGADIVAHSATKYLNGHSDVLAGAVVTARDDEFWQRIRRHRYLNGLLPGAFEAWLLLRGMRTLFVRVRQASGSALAVAEHFADHPCIERVLYPGLPDHPGHEIASRQMRDGFGAMLSMCIRGGAADAIRVAKACNIFLPATSLGGVESLIEHRHTSEPPGTGTPENLLRLSIGIEQTADLIADLEQALGGLED